MSSESTSGSLGSRSHWILALKDGDDDAATHLWRRYFPKLITVAGRRLGRAERRVADEEDIALSAFASLCQGAREGRFEQSGGRDYLCKLLVAITGLKSVE